MSTLIFFTILSDPKENNEIEIHILFCEVSVKLYFIFLHNFLLNNHKIKIITFLNLNNKRCSMNFTEIQVIF